jgi:hypothetical protein
VEADDMTERKTELRDGAAGRAVHDVGGLDFGPIDRHEHDLALWEKRVDAMMILLYAKKGCFKVDAMRRVIEDYGEQAYDATTYYQKWVRAMRNLLVEQEVLSKAEVEARMAAVAARHAADGRAVDTAKIDW